MHTIYIHQLKKWSSNGKKTSNIQINYIIISFRRCKHLAYRCFECSCWGYLGRKVQWSSHPSCVVRRIQQKYPETEGQYLDFRAALSWTWTGMQPQLQQLEDGGMQQTGWQEQGSFWAPPGKAGVLESRPRRVERSALGHNLDKIFNRKYMSSCFVTFVFHIYIINWLGYIPCVACDFIGFTVYPPFFAFGKWMLYFRVPAVVFAWVRFEFSLKWSAARYCLKEVKDCNDESILPLLLRHAKSMVGWYLTVCKKRNCNW